MSFVWLIGTAIVAPLMWWSGYVGYRALGMTRRMKLWLIVAGIASGTAILADLLIVAGGVSGWVRVVASLTAREPAGSIQCHTPLRLATPARYPRLTSAHLHNRRRPAL